MRKEYDFSKMQGKPNPYAKLLKKRITINLPKVLPCPNDPQWLCLNRKD